MMPSQDIFVRAAMPVQSAPNPDSSTVVATRVSKRRGEVDVDSLGASRDSNFVNDTGPGYDIMRIEQKLGLLNETDAMGFRYRIAAGEDLSDLEEEM